VPRRDPHPILDSETAEGLRLLSDPELSRTVPLPDLDAAQAALLLRVANLHGTIATTRRHVRERVSSGAMDAARPLALAVEDSAPTAMAAVGEALQLRHWGERIMAAFRERGVGGTIVKGPLAAALFPDPNDRRFTDIDIVIRPDQVALAREILTALDFFANDIPGHDAVEHCEYKFALRSSPTVAVEVQTDLIHSARQRQRASVGLAAIEAAGAGDPRDPTALLYVAGVHASYGHQFEHLDLLVDVLQAGRERAGPVDPERLASVGRKTGTLRGIAAALALAARVYDDAACASLARRLMPGRPPLEWRLVSPQVVMRALSESGWWVAWRRKVFRQLIALPAPGG
jgi:hypothetical protein